MWMNSLRVENFLISFSIRVGVLIILWSVMLSSSYGLILVWSFINVNGGTADQLFNLISLFVGEVLAVLNLIYFPAPNKTYSPNSITSKSLKYFAWYLGCIIVFLGVVFGIFSFRISYEGSYNILFGYYTYAGGWKVLALLLISCIAIPTLLIAALLHLMAVIHTFRVSLLPNKNLDEIQKDVNVLDK